MASVTVRASFTDGTTSTCDEVECVVENDDEADAAALWDYQCGFLRPDLAHRTTPLFQGRG